jgi:hypothetical protein
LPAIIFKAGFQAGQQHNVQMVAADIPGLNSGWKRMGWWIVGAATETAPSAVSVNQLLPA